MSTGRMVVYKDNFLLDFPEHLVHDPIGMAIPSARNVERFRALGAGALDLGTVRSTLRLRARSAFLQGHVSALFVEDVVKLA